MAERDATSARSLRSSAPSTSGCAPGARNNSLISHTVGPFRRRIHTTPVTPDLPNAISPSRLVRQASARETYLLSRYPHAFGCAALWSVKACVRPSAGRRNSSRVRSLGLRVLIMRYRFAADPPYDGITPKRTDQTTEGSPADSRRNISWILVSGVNSGWNAVAISLPLRTATGVPSSS